MAAAKQATGAGTKPALPELVYQFPADAPGGGVRVVHTAGILKEQLQRVGDLTTPRAGQPKWQELQAAARAWLRDKMQLPDLKYLTQPQGDELLAVLRAHPALKPDVPPSSEQDALLDAMLVETATVHLRDKVVALITKSKGVDLLTQVSLPDLKQMLAEVRSMVTDPQVFGLMLEQALANPSAA